MNKRALFWLLSGGLLSFGAAAQWQWIDQDGRHVFSDRAPPASVPDKNIVKRPTASQGAPAPAPDASAPRAPAQGAASAAKPGVLNAMLADQQRKAEQAQTSRRQADEARQAGIRADNCQRARRAKSALDAGARMSQTNAQGEREVMDEAARAAETRRLQAIIDSDCQ